MFCWVKGSEGGGGALAHQNLSSSFDPFNLLCTTCDIEHKIVSSDKPSCIIVSDQTFVGNLSGNGSGNCIAVVRIEGGSLTELKDIVIEMFKGVNFPPGSLILMGSASHLDSHGVTIYAIEWTGLVSELAKKFENVQVGPLTTFPREGLSGDLADSYVQLTYWHS